MKNEPKTACRTPATGRDGVTNIPTWKYDALRKAILAEVIAAGDNGVAFAALSDLVKAHLSADELHHLGSVGWHTTCVKLNMEVEGEIARKPGVTPQRLVLASARAAG